MYLLIFAYIIVYSIIYILLRIYSYNKHKNRKTSKILFNATYIEKNVTPEEVFNILDEAGIEIIFIGPNE